MLLAGRGAVEAWVMIVVAHPDDETISQRDLLAGFDTEVEHFRTAPHYDFTRPPHPGELYNERPGWSVSGELRRHLAREALDALGDRSPTWV